MSFWNRSVAIFKSIRTHGNQSVRRIAERTGLAKSSVHRLSQAMERRNVYPESWFWETEEGRDWLKRLVVATLYLFSLKRGVGSRDPQRVLLAPAPAGSCWQFPLCHPQYPTSSRNLSN